MLIVPCRQLSLRGSTCAQMSLAAVSALHASSNLTLSSRSFTRVRVPASSQCTTGDVTLSCASSNLSAMELCATGVGASVSQRRTDDDVNHLAFSGRDPTRTRSRSGRTNQLVSHAEGELRTQFHTVNPISCRIRILHVVGFCSCSIVSASSTRLCSALVATVGRVKRGHRRRSHSASGSLKVRAAHVVSAVVIGF